MRVLDAMSTAGFSRLSRRGNWGFDATRQWPLLATLPGRQRRHEAAGMQSGA